MTLTILFLILTTILIVDVFAVTLSYSMCWYEYANADPQLIKQRFSSRALLMTASLLGQELFFNYVTVLSMPFGLWPQRQKVQARG